VDPDIDSVAGEPTLIIEFESPTRITDAAERNVIKGVVSLDDINLSVRDLRIKFDLGASTYN
jgi:hypothetical protein